VLFVKPRYWVIVDDLTGTGEHSFELRFQFAPRPVAHREDLWTCAPGATTGGLWLKPFSNVPLSASVRQGREDPMEGWVSRHYGRREPAPVVVYGAMTMLPARVVTLLMPARERQAMLRPPHVEALGLPEGIVTGLRLRESGEIVLVEEDAIHVLGGAAMRDAHLAVTCG
jgi:hypothetical protein